MSKVVLNNAAMQITCGMDRARFVISFSSDAFYISKWREYGLLFSVFAAGKRSSHFAFEIEEACYFVNPLLP